MWIQALNWNLHSSSKRLVDGTININMSWWWWSCPSHSSSLIPFLSSHCFSYGMGAVGMWDMSRHHFMEKTICLFLHNHQRSQRTKGSETLLWPRSPQVTAFDWHYGHLRVRYNRLWLMSSVCPCVRLSLWRETNKHTGTVSSFKIKLVTTRNNHEFFRLNCWQSRFNKIFSSVRADKEWFSLNLTLVSCGRTSLPFTSK